MNKRQNRESLLVSDLKNRRFGKNWLYFSSYSRNDEFITFMLREIEPFLGTGCTGAAFQFSVEILFSYWKKRVCLVEIHEGESILYLQNFGELLKHSWL